MRRLQGWLRVALIDLRGSAARFLILIACLALGVAAIGTVSAVRSSVETAVQRDATLILGGDLELRSQHADIGADVRAALDKLGTTSRQVELNSQARFADKTAFLALRGVTDAYPLVGTVTLAQGAMAGSVAELLRSRKGVFGVLLSQQATLRLGVAPGAMVHIGALDVQLRGIIDAFPDQATAGFQLGAPALISDQALAPAGLQQEGVLTQYRYKVVLATGGFDDAKATLDRQFPGHEWQIRSPRQATTAIARFITIFGNFMLVVALSSMIVGGLGTANAVTAYIGERQATIATMRSLGASGRRILLHFLVQIAVLSIIAVLVGLVVVGIATLTLLPLLSSLIGLVLPATLDLRSMAVAAGIGLVTALIFSWLPLLQARAIRPAMLFRAGSTGPLAGQGWRVLTAPASVIPILMGFGVVFALTLIVANDVRLVAIYFAGTLVAFGLLRLAAFVLTRALAASPVPRQRLLRLAISAITRPGAPTATVLVSMGMGLSLLLLIVTTQSNINDQITAEVGNSAPDFVLLDMNKTAVDALEAFVTGTPEVETLTTVPMLRGTITKLKGAPPPSAEAAPIEVADMFRGDTALSWAAAEPQDTSIDEGKWWPADYSGPPLVSLTTDMRDALHLALGDTITISISGRPLEMTIASFRLIDRRSPNFTFRIIVSPGVIEGAPQSYLGTIKAVPEKASFVEAKLIAGFPLLTFVSVGEALARVRSIFDGLANAIALVSGTAVIAGVLVLAGALSVGRKQREADAVVMKVLGARRRTVISAFLIEYALLGAIAAALAIIIALLGAWAASTWLLQIGFSVQPLQLGLLAILVVAVTITTGALTTWSAISARPAERLRAETS
ncbi:MAG TPA: FtsX-like permease family protein [Devosiaceae bacterium]|jgi:putative ABC transport system permease protein